MRAFIKQTNETSLFEQARIGFIQMGYECIYYTQLPKDITLDDVVVGFISDTHQACKILNIDIPESIDYPSELKHYLNRHIKRIKTESLDQNYPYFIKPINHKQFKGTIVKEFKDLIGIPSTELYYTKDILNIMSEYRIFIKNKEITAVKHYKGNPFITINEGVVKNMINEYTTQPKVYTLDVGSALIDNKLETILIEVNAGYSSGNYGMGEIEYAKFLKDGYFQLISR